MRSVFSSGRGAQKTGGARGVEEARGGEAGGGGGSRRRSFSTAAGGAEKKRAGAAETTRSAEATGAAETEAAAAGGPPEAAAAAAAGTDESKASRASVRSTPTQPKDDHKHCSHPQLPSSSKWGQQSASSINQAHNALSLAEIQKLEEERERQTREEVRAALLGLSVNA